MLRFLLCLFALNFLLSPCAAESAPDVSRADQNAIKRAFGDKIAAKIFSSDLTSLRLAASRSSK